MNDIILCKKKYFDFFLKNLILCPFLFHPMIRSRRPQDTQGISVSLTICIYNISLNEIVSYYFQYPYQHIWYGKCAN